MIRNRRMTNNCGRTVNRFALALVLAGVLFGCASAPVQEMSDARQTIDAAREAGAARHAPDGLAKAEQLLREATSDLENRRYEQARERARMAREAAQEARRQAMDSAR